MRRKGGFVDRNFLCL